MKNITKQILAWLRDPENIWLLWICVGMAGALLGAIDIISRGVTP